MAWNTGAKSLPDIQAEPAMPVAAAMRGPVVVIVCSLYNLRFGILSLQMS